MLTNGKRAKLKVYVLSKPAVGRFSNIFPNHFLVRWIFWLHYNKLDFNALMHYKVKIYHLCTRGLTGWVWPLTCSLPGSGQCFSLGINRISQHLNIMFTSVHYCGHKNRQQSTKMQQRNSLSVLKVPCVQKTQLLSRRGHKWPTLWCFRLKPPCYPTPPSTGQTAALHPRGAETAKFIHRKEKCLINSNMKNRHSVGNKKSLIQSCSQRNPMYRVQLFYTKTHKKWGYHRLNRRVRRSQRSSSWHWGRCVWTNEKTEVSFNQKQGFTCLTDPH